MSKILFASIVLLAAAVAAPAELLETAPSDPIERGRYIANSVSMCVQCHSPHDRQGDLIPSQLFSGQAMPFQSPYAGGPKWAFRTPALKRLPGWSVDEFVGLLMTGKRSNGIRPASPMPQFRMSRQDAEALAAYLKSL
jgi:mono/diheme cytochrome c family protein